VTGRADPVAPQHEPDYLTTDHPAAARGKPPSMTLPFVPAGAGAADIAAMAESARKAADLMKALSHETRLLIVCILAQGERSVSELETLLALPQAAVSQQLARLRLDGVVAARRDGRAIFYALADGEIVQLVAALYELFCRTACDPDAP
jgi:DNA-binding transcriptional ArsR family regulator